jgi:hypothetical protein
MMAPPGASSSSGRETMMTTNNDHAPGQNPHHAREGSNTITRASPRRMPAGGWIREIATSENWRTTTVVRRHRDRAAAPASF